MNIHKYNTRFQSNLKNYLNSKKYKKKLKKKN